LGIAQMCLTYIPFWKSLPFPERALIKRLTNAILIF
jgi:hypothetical protein